MKTHTTRLAVEQRRLQPEQAVSHHFSPQEGAKAYRLFVERQAGTQKIILDAGTVEHT